MPAAAVIPAPIAYIKVAAVKTLVVEFRSKLSSRRVVLVLIEYFLILQLGEMTRCR